MFDFFTKLMEDLSPRARLATACAALLVASGGAAIAYNYIETAKPCEIIKVGPLEKDRSRDCPARPGKSANRSSGEPDDPAVPSSPALHHAAIEVQPLGHRTGEAHAASGLMLIEAEFETLDSMPRGTFAYAWSARFANHWRDEQDQLTVSHSMRAEYFELEKRQNGERYLIGYVRGDVAKALQNDSELPRSIKVFARRFGKTDVVVAVPVALLESVGQDEVVFPSNFIIPVLELTLKEPVIT